MSVARFVALLAAAAATAALLAAAARADGDPASDYLLTQQVFLPFDVKFPREKEQRLAGLVAAANRAGFKIRVALIGSSYDLGAITSLWGKPRPYARFLGEELTFVYRQRLLVVMPKGFGFYRPHHSPAAEYALLDKIRIAPGGAGLADAASAAVQRLAAADGLKLAPVSPPHSSRTRDRLIILAAAVAALLLAVEARRVLRRRRR